MKNNDLETLEEFSSFEQQLKEIGEDIKNSPTDENKITMLEKIITNMFTKLVGTFENLTSELDNEIKTLK